MSLTKKKLNNLLGRKHIKAFELADRDSLSVRVSAKGKIAWQYRFRFNKKTDRITIGHYPYLSIEKAREEVPKLRGWLFEGKNPKQEWNNLKNKNNEKAQITLEALAKLWFDKVAEKKFKATTYENYRSTLSKWIHNEPKSGSLDVKWVKKNLNIPFDSITNFQWMNYFDWICQEGSPVTSGSVFKLLKTIIKWGEQNGYVNNLSLLLYKVNDVGSPSQKGMRKPSLYEIAKLWIEIEKSKALPQSKICLKLLILTGGRNTAIRIARWCDIDFDNMIWTIPNPKGKKQTPRRGTHVEDDSNQNPERHPISQKMKELLDELAFIYGVEGYIFKGGNNGSALSIQSIDKYCSRMSSKLFLEHGISKIIPHDFRRSITSIMSEHDRSLIPICDKILGHILQGTMAHYNLAEYLKDQLEVYEEYWSQIEKEIVKVNS